MLRQKALARAKHTNLAHKLHDRKIARLAGIGISHNACIKELQSHRKR